MRWKYGVCLLVLAQLTGCATSSVLLPYPQRAQGYVAAIRAGQPQQPLPELAKQEGSRDGLLFALERGRLAQLAGNGDESRRSFARALAQFEAIDGRALISLSRSAATGVSLLTNDNARPYEGYGWERTFAHAYQALNYLAASDRDGAMVEMRRATSIQEQLQQKHQALIDDAREADNKERAGADPEHFQQYFAAMEDAANHVRNSFQNAASYYLAALLSEADKDSDAAYIDYKRALAIAPDNPQLQRDVLRLARRQQDQEAIHALSKAVSNRDASGRDISLERPAGAGEVVLWYEEGQVPAKAGVMVPIPYPQALAAVAFPVYDKPWAIADTLHVQADAGVSVDTALLTDVHALAARGLRDELWPMILRQSLRLVAKVRMQKNLEEQGHPLLAALASVYNVVSEQADLRSWLSLPNSVQLARVSLPAGAQPLQLKSALAEKSLIVPVAAGRITLVHVVSMGEQIYTAIYAL